MSYSIFRVNGISNTGKLNGLSKHNIERKSKTNPDIDLEKSKDNIHLIECQKTYKMRFNDITNEYRKEHNEKMQTTRKDRVKTFEQYVNDSKNNVATEMIFTSDSEFFKDMPKDQVEHWAKSSLDFVLKDMKIPKENIIHAILHLDEKTPHMHVVAVPLVKEYDKRTKKEQFSIKQGKFVGQRKDLIKLQDLYHARMKSSGYDLERGERDKKAKHKETIDFKREQAQKELVEAKEKASDIVSSAKNDIKSVKDNLAPLKAEYEAKKAYVDKIIKSSDISNMYPDYTEKTKKGLINKKEYVTVPKEQWEQRWIARNHINAVDRERESLEKEIESFYNDAPKVRELQGELTELRESLTDKDKKLKRIDDILKSDPKLLENFNKQAEIVTVNLKNKNRSMGMER